MITWVKAHQNTIAYIILGVAVSIALWQTNTLASDRADDNAHKVAEQALLNDQICEENAKTRQAVIDFVIIQTRDSEIPPGASDELRRTIEASNRRRAEIRQATQDQFNPPLCADGLSPVSKATTTTAPAGTTTTTGP